MSIIERLAASLKVPASELRDNILYAVVEYSGVRDTYVLSTSTGKVRTDKRGL